ncbi:MAG: 30S ribosomal protein S12 methylthiotransferase RimO [Coriobacteriales bacterium]|nr:30S ribosomal protein S12 methylthiotransferase RimO [Coriobacteriales bacterium]
MTDLRPEPFRVALVTLGCAKNEADSRAMCTRLEQQGFYVGARPDAADFILLNTCAFIEAAVEESLDTVFELAALERVQSGETRLLIAGCLPSRFGEELARELPEAAAFVPVAEEAGVAEALLRLLEQDAGGGGGAEVEGEGEVGFGELEPQPWAYVKISDGCSRRCSYCTIPAIRGPYLSYPFEHIKAEVSELVAGGAREIILVGQDTGIWREPSSGERADTRDTATAQAAPSAPAKLAELLAALAEQHPQIWFRVMYLQPEGISDELLEVMAAHANIARYLDIPLQHASVSVLAAMHRRGSGQEYLELLERIRRVLPGVVLRTTVMTGFPGESEDDFEQLCQFLCAARFDYVGIFAYSREEGTVAAGLPQQVDTRTAFERVQILRDLADSIGFERAQSKVAREVLLLICGRDEEGLFGRTQGQAPEVDGITYLVMSDNAAGTAGADAAGSAEPKGAGTTSEEMLSETTLKPGAFVRARITEAVLYDLFAEVL